MHGILQLVKETLGRHIDGLVQEGRNSNANALELRLSCIKPSWTFQIFAFSDFKNDYHSKLSLNSYWDMSCFLKYCHAENRDGANFEIAQI